jgi:uncharacterized protein (TIGR02687 family)
MNNISKRLTALFDKHNIIFWYDENGELEDQYNTLDIGVKKLKIKNNQFNIKYQINSSKDDKFLVYSDKKEPTPEENWLLGLQLRSYMFSADRASIILNDLGLDIIHKQFILKHIKFFDAKSRLNSFAKLIDNQDNDKSLALKMIATLAKTPAILEKITIKLFSNDKLYNDIQKYKLEEYLWDMINVQYRYNEQNPSIKDLGYKLLQNHFYSFVDKNKMMLGSEAVLFIKSWMDSSSSKGDFINLSALVEDELSIENIVNDCEVSNLLECDSYEICEQKVISHIKSMIQSNSFMGDEILDICTKREHTFWYTKYENIYKAFKYAVKITNMIKSIEYNYDSFDDGVSKYALEYSKVDYYYRKYIFSSNKGEHNNILKELDEQIENIYLNDYLRVLNDKWQEYIKDYRSSNISYQRDFYTQYVESKEQRVFVIISDALRYECAIELNNRITSLDKYISTINPMVGVLPSYTQLGVASLLPNNTLTFDASDDSVYIDGKSTKGSENRDKILKLKDERSVYINSEMFLDLNRDDGREFVKAHNIIYIYHNEIDATGDKRESEHKVFNAVDESFVTIENLIKKISNLNGHNILITSDHGFLYSNNPTANSELCTVEKPDNANRFNRRFIIADEIKENNCIKVFNAEDLKIDCSKKIAITNSINKIKTQGGGNRFVHGGATLQEMVVPLICVSKKRSGASSRNVDISCHLPNKITTNSIMCSCYQEEPIGDKVLAASYKIEFIAKDGTSLSNSKAYTFNSSDSENRNREVKLQIDLKSNASDYSGQNIKLVVKRIIENSTEEPIYKEYDVKLQLTFANDFDEF